MMMTIHTLTHTHQLFWWHFDVITRIKSPILVFFYLHPNGFIHKIGIWLEWQFLYPVYFLLVTHTQIPINRIKTQQKLAPFTLFRMWNCIWAGKNLCRIKFQLPQIFTSIHFRCASLSEIPFIDRNSLFFSQIRFFFSSIATFKFPLQWCTFIHRAIKTTIDCDYYGKEKRISAYHSSKCNQSKIYMVTFLHSINSYGSITIYRKQNWSPLKIIKPFFSPSPSCALSLSFHLSLSGVARNIVTNSRCLIKTTEFAIQVKVIQFDYKWR